MIENTPNIPASRGRIIKRGGIGTPARPVDAPSKQGGHIRQHARAPGQKASALTLQNGVTLFVFLPILFCLSAAITWSRPLGLQEVVTTAGEVRLSDRFHSIGSELAGRFSPTVRGNVLAPPSKRPTSVKASKAQPEASRASLPVSGSPPPRHPHREALEKQVYKILKKHGKPSQNGKGLASAIVKEAIAQDYDPVFVAAVIKSESAFNALARSHKGAQGLMQIMPRTGAWLADRNDIPRGKLTDPGHNLKLGITYLKQLEAENKGNRMLTLVAYNWGPGHVESAASGARRVPGEVMQYAVKILNDYRRWSSELRSSVG